MPGIRCAVYGCNNNLLTIKKRGENVIFHAFPKKKNFVNNTIRLEWINRCKRADKFNPDTHKICSVHFCEQSYERDMQNELLGLPLKKKLKSTAVPTLHLPNRKNTTVTDRERSRGGTNQQIISELFTNPKNNENKSESTGESPETSTMHQNVLSEDSYKLKYEELLAQHTKLQNNYSSLVEENKKEIKRLTDLLRYYKNKNSRNPNAIEGSSNLLSKVLRKIFKLSLRSCGCIILYIYKRYNRE
ncbi:hypothetical protein RI129_004480 [Pyrocoelia pectoralis]|uniref:THAP-type domain-containing protein n=1 Tax=Pyrocoelia pectoralis TaxID=417401 RepID=A0AAN7VIB2_9COLE